MWYVTLLSPQDAIKQEGNNSKKHGRETVCKQETNQSNKNSYTYKVVDFFAI